ncbi:MAG: sigma-70 family RNA polymerase sigma factor [Anaerolineae bacterium]|nr:sigma-70 family RNA polymerase sigma factor [Anaerolineae bacterium]
MDIDPNLLGRAYQRDESALEAIFDAYYPALYRYLYHHTGHIQTAEDLTATVFQRFLEQIYADKPPITHLSGWLFRVAYRLMVDDIRRTKVRDSDALPDDVPTESLTEQTVFTQMQTAQIHETLAQLPARQREVLLLRYIAELDLSATAHVLGMNINAVKALQHRATTNMKRILTLLGELL